MSKVIKYICDCCGKEIPVVTKTDCFGVQHQYLESGSLESIGTNIFKHGTDLCKDCAHKIDIALIQWRFGTLMTASLVEKRRRNG